MLIKSSLNNQQNIFALNNPKLGKKFNLILTLDRASIIHSLSLKIKAALHAERAVRKEKSKVSI